MIQRVRESFRQGGCDGVFLSAVSNLGVRLPVSKIVRALEATGPLRFVVVDGAQELNHVPTDLSTEHCDLYLAGTHKWLGGFHPMGLGFYGRRQSRGMIETRLSRLMGRGDIDDPLLQLSTRFETGRTDQLAETVSLVPLFSCHGAVADSVRSGVPRGLTDLPLLADLAMQADWTPLLPEGDMRTAILLLQSTHEAVRVLAPNVVRERFGRRGVAVTSYPGGLIRLSLPGPGLEPEGRAILRSALEGVCSS